MKETSVLERNTEWGHLDGCVCESAQVLFVVSSLGLLWKKAEVLSVPLCLPTCMPVSLCYPFVCIYAPSSIMNFYITPNTDSSTLVMADTHQSACVLTSLYKTMFNQSINLFKKCLFIQSVSYSFCVLIYI